MNKSKLKKITSARLFLPIVCLIAVLLLNVIRTPDFFNVSIRNGVLYGYIIDVINRASELVILGRWLLTNPDYLILDEPTRGIDIGTKTEIQKLVLDLADQGMAVTFISSEVEEMLRTCSRMAVLRDGQKVGELEEDELSQSGVMKAIAGGDDK